MFSYWRYFTFPKESIEGCRDLINQYNIRTLRIISFAAFVLLILFSFFPLLIEKEPRKFIVYLITAVVELGAYGCGRWIEKRHLKRIPVFLGFLLFFSCTIAFGIYIGVITQPKGQAINFMVFLICTQIIFVMDPLWNLAINAVVLLVFSSITFRVKGLSHWQIDMVNALVASVGGIIFNWYMSHVVVKEMLTARRLEEERNRFEAESIRDDLTGLSNHRDFFQRLDFYIAAARHVRQTLCIIMMDVDHFKAYNDFYGHLKGDQVLKAIGGVLSRLTTEEKVFTARVGGEEFIVLWTENRLSEAQGLALKLRQRIIDLQIPHEKSQAAPYITASFGLYFLRGNTDTALTEANITAEELYEHADQALYEAKKQGRDRIILLDSADKSFRQIVRADERTEPGL
ncbi:hypothetical protein FACS189450_02860 [Spirochaetia bacterium]|nr:hypothetical protein FACS189450_02860 [Spirochaetia bacterium]